MSHTVPLLALDAGASLLLDPWLEVTAHCGAPVEFELIEDPGDETVRRAAERVVQEGRGVSLAALEGIGLLAAFEARVRHHSGGELPAAFTDPFGLRGFERGSAGAARLRSALAEAEPGPRGERVPAPAEDAGLGLLATTSAAAAAVVEAAFAYAAERGASVTIVHRASAAPATEGLFMHAARNVAVRHPETGFEALAFDEFARRAVRDRASLEVLAGPATAVDPALEVLAAVAGVPPPPGQVIGRGGARLFGRHGAPGGLAALLRAAVVLFDDLGLGAAARRLERALAEAALHADFERYAAELVTARLR